MELGPVTPVGYCRVTVATPRARVDLALPESVPLAELLPEIMRWAGDTAVEPTGDRRALARLGHPPMPADTTLADHGVRDGEILYLVSLSDPPPPARVDDPVGALAAETDRLPGRWGPVSAARTTALTGCGLAALAVLPLALAASRTAGVIGLVLALIALALAGAVRRSAVARQAWLAEGLGALGVVHAVAGAGLLGGSSGAVIAVGVGAGLAGVGVALGLAVPSVLPVAAGLAAAGSTTAAVAAGAVSGGILRSAAVAAVVWSGLAYLLPAVLLRITGVTAATVEAATAAVPQPEGSALATLARAHLARRVLRALLWSAGVATAGGAVILAVAGGRFAWALAGVLGVLALLHARAFPFVVERLALLAPAVIAGAGLVARLALVHATSRPWVIAAVLAPLAVMVLAATGLTRRAPGPAVTAWLDRAEVLAALAVLPLLLGVLGVYGDVDTAARGGSP